MNSHCPGPSGARNPLCSLKRSWVTEVCGLGPTAVPAPCLGGAGEAQPVSGDRRLLIPGRPPPPKEAPGVWTFAEQSGQWATGLWTSRRACAEPGAGLPPGTEVVSFKERCVFI